MKERAKEQDDIPLPWHPESEKPTVPFVICTNGEGHYWMGQYYDANNRWVSKTAKCFNVYEDVKYEPLAWCSPQEFVPYKKQLHRCEEKCNQNSANYACFENNSGTLTLTCNRSHDIECKVCPFCGYKAGEK